MRKFICFPALLILAIAGSCHAQVIRLNGNLFFGKEYLEQSSVAPFGPGYITKVDHPYTAPTAEVSALYKKKRFGTGLSVGFSMQDYEMIVNGPGEFLGALSTISNQGNVYQRTATQYFLFGWRNEFLVLPRPQFNAYVTGGLGYRQRYNTDVENVSGNYEFFANELIAFHDNFRNHLYWEAGPVLELSRKRWAFSMLYRRNITPAYAEGKGFTGQSSVKFGASYNFAKINLPKRSYTKQKEELLTIKDNTQGLVIGVRLSFPVYSHLNSTGVAALYGYGQMYIAKDNVKLQPDFPIYPFAYLKKTLGGRFDAEAALGYRMYYLQADQLVIKYDTTYTTRGDFSGLNGMLSTEGNLLFHAVKRGDHKVSLAAGIGLQQNVYKEESFSRVITVNPGAQYAFAGFAFRANYHIGINELPLSNVAGNIEVSDLRYGEISLIYDIHRFNKKGRP